MRSRLNTGKDLAAVLQALEISEATLARCRARFGGMKSEEAKWREALEDDNRRLEQLVADQALDIHRREHLRRETGEPSREVTWQREGLNMPQKKRNRRRLGTSANGCH
jgi:putative transposase